MATPSFTQSLFGGIDPYKIQRENMQQLFAPIQQAQDPYSKIGAALGTLGGMALFGMPQDPRLAKVTEIQQTVQQVMGEAPDEATFAERLPLLQQAFTEKGLIDQAAIVGERIKALAPKEKSTEEQAKAAIFSISQIPPEQRTAEQNTLFNASQVVLGGSTAGSKVQSSKVLPDGTTVTIYNNGTREVLNPNGEVVTGKNAAEAIRNAEKFGATIAGERVTNQTLNRLVLESRFASQIAGGREAGEAGVKLGVKAFEKVGAIRGNINNLKSAQKALLEGANTGFIASRLPDITAASIELSNVRNQLGLDIVGSVTFGALSEGELALALNTALPTNLDEEALKAHIISKIDAQTKLANYLEEQAKFLSKPGNTLDKWFDKIEAGERRTPGGSGGGSSGKSGGKIEILGRKPAQ